MERNPRAIAERGKENLESDESSQDVIGLKRYNALVHDVKHIIDLLEYKHDLELSGKDVVLLEEKMINLRENIKDNFGLFSESLTHDIRSLETLNILEFICERGQDDMQESALRTINEHAQEIASCISKQDSHLGYVAASMLLRLIQNGDAEQSEEAYDLLRDTIDNVHFSSQHRGDPQYEAILQFAIVHGNSETKQRAIKKTAVFRAEQFLAEMGLPSKDFISAWQQGSSAKEFTYTIESNMRIMRLIEDRCAGIVSYLHKEYGISNFARYPVDVLIAQYAERENTDMPYGIILYPMADHNNAFYNNQHAIDGLYRTIRGAYLIRVCEAGDKIDVVRRLGKLNKHYGKTQKVSFAIIGGHGAKQSIQFGEPPAPATKYAKRYILRSEDLLDPRSGRNTYFIENPTIVLNSCSTGEIGGIGQKLSVLMGAHVIAPPIPSGIKTFGATITKEGGVHFNTEYHATDAAAYSSGMPTKEDA